MTLMTMNKGTLISGRHIYISFIEGQGVRLPILLETSSKASLIVLIDVPKSLFTPAIILFLSNTKAGLMSTNLQFSSSLGQTV